MKEDTTTIDPTWMEKTGGFARDKTLRDEFAMRAMQAQLSMPEVFAAISNGTQRLLQFAAVVLNGQTQCLL